jgi:DNA-binding transcriptional ArsR family regulator
MVQYSTTVDRAFAALADPTRRAVPERLGSGNATIGELAEPFGMSLTGMKKHIRLLEEAELVTTEKVVRRCMLAPYAFEGISTWLQRLDRFAQVVERRRPMNTTTVTTPDELEIRVERIFDAPRAPVFSVWTDPKLIPEWWATARSSRRWTSVPAARTASAPTTVSSRAGSARSTRPSGSCRRSRVTCGRSSSRIWATGRR